MGGVIGKIGYDAQAFGQDFNDLMSKVFWDLALKKNNPAEFEAYYDKLSADLENTWIRHDVPSTILEESRRSFISAVSRIVRMNPALREPFVRDACTALLRSIDDSKVSPRSIGQRIESRAMDVLMQGGLSQDTARKSLVLLMRLKNLRMERMLGEIADLKDIRYVPLLRVLERIAGKDIQERASSVRISILSSSSLPETIRGRESSRASRLSLVPNRSG